MFSRPHVRSLVAVLAALMFISASCTDSGEDGDEATGEGSAEIEVGPDGYGAIITRTSDGVPHVRAADLRSVSFGQGWASAEDHPCDLVDQIIEIHSQRAATFGVGEDEENVESDFGWAALGVVDAAMQDWPQIEGDELDQIEGFTAGWNESYEAQGVDGIEDWCSGEEWMRPVTREEVYTYSRSVALLASGARLVDFIAAAQPPGTEDAPPGDEVALPAQDPAPVASNGWAIGSDRSESGGGMVIGNPHFPWIGELRFSEVHLTTDDGIDAYGAQLLGLPGVGLGFTDGVAWTHTVSAGRRFTAYSMDLVPGDPTSYLMDGEPVAMDAEEIAIEVLDGDGDTEERTRTYYSTEFGPVMDFPGIGWTDTATTSYRDANIDNDALGRQYIDMNRAQSVEELQEAQEEHQGIPLFNTIAADAEGNTWYADTSATPNLSSEALAAYEQRLEADGLTKLAKGAGAVLLEGNTSRDRWVEDPDAPWSGVIPWSGLPGQERADYVMNANDSYWIANSGEPVAGVFSPLQGPSETARSVRTRQNLFMLDDTSAEGPSGADGLFDLDELSAAALDDRAYTELQWHEGVLERCRATADTPVRSEDLLDEDGTVVVPSRDVALTPACDALEGWDGHYDLESTGAAMWREFTEQISYDDLWAEPFDPARPADTPAGLGPAVVDGVDQVTLGLANALALLEFAGVSPDAPLGELQYDGRLPTTRQPVHGGLGSEGVTNVVSDSRTSASTTQDQPAWPDRLVDGSTLTTEGYPISYGTSFLMAVAFGDDGPEGRTILTYGQVGDPTSSEFTAGVEAFAAKEYKPALFDAADIEADEGAEVTEVSA